jgi:predicted branched-subunit amino acid permease
MPFFFGHTVTQHNDTKTVLDAEAGDDNIYALPSWAKQATPRDAFWRGTRRGIQTPGIILTITALGFGALAHDAGLSLFNTVAMMVVFFALPAQVVLVDQISRGASLLAGCLAVTLTGVRLLPMTVSLMPFLKEHHTSMWWKLLAAHFVAVTAWIEGMRWVPQLPPHLRMPHFIGIGVSLVLATMLGTAVGHLIAGILPTNVARVLPFLTPIYFLISMLASARTAADHLPIVAGVIIGPLVYLFVPDLDLVLAGLIGGTLAHFGAKRLGNG